MRKIIEAKALPDKKLFIKYSNGMEGKISLEKLTTRERYDELKNIDVFENLVIDEKSGDVIVNGDIELCKNAMYGILDLKKQMAGLGLSMDD
ncbi:MAG: DUF2442 domain-containing protein [Melioribacteraceae bacterium]|jgi:hypothetical protein|nr:DUF2442 domain-containing protein [Melioribacteraceae bacterium]